MLCFFFYTLMYLFWTFLVLSNSYGFDIDGSNFFKDLSFNLFGDSPNLKELPPDALTVLNPSKAELYPTE